jgi:hypothetical protein
MEKDRNLGGPKTAGTRYWIVFARLFSVRPLPRFRPGALGKYQSQNDLMQKQRKKKGK